MRAVLQLLLAAVSTSYHLPMAPRPVARTEVRAHRVSPVRMEAFSFDPFNRDVFRILMDAQSEARVLGAPAVGTQHMLLAATLQKDGVAASLEAVGVTSSSLRQVLGKSKGSVPGLDRLLAVTAKDELLPFGKDTERALKTTVTRAGRRSACRSPPGTTGSRPGA